MSRVGKAPISIPDGVEVTLDGASARVKGKLGENRLTLPPHVVIEHEENSLRVVPKNLSKPARQCWGTARQQIFNAVHGVSQGFQKRLEVFGVGYRAQLRGSQLILLLGFSHEVAIDKPDDIKVAIEGERDNVIVLSGIDKQRVGQFARRIRQWRPPEPYKGKGVLYAGERVNRKEGKKK